MSPLEACWRCKPGDILFTPWGNDLRLNQRLPMLSSAPRFSSGSRFRCYLPFSAAMLVIAHECGSNDVFVLCAGQLGWINENDVDRLERV